MGPWRPPRSLRWPAGQRAGLLDEACLGYGQEDTFALSARLRRRYPPALVAAALTQARLRTRAAQKLDPADAGRMLFTDAGLQQATRQPSTG